MISVELNTAVKSKLLTLGTPYSTVQFIPLSAYQSNEGPFVVYTQFDGTQSEEQFFLKVANVVYNVYDTDISRMKDVAYQIEKFLNVGSGVEEIKSLLSTPYYTSSGSPPPLRYRITTSRKVAGSTRPPLEREGFSSYTLNFRIVYLDDGWVLS